MQSQNRVIAIACADLHLQHKAPIWRSNEPDWYDAMKRPLMELRSLQQEYEGCPVLCAGDIFDDGEKATPELINFALACLPDNFYSIAGQHDMPNHNIGEVFSRSAFGTLIETNKISLVPNDSLKEMDVFGYDFGMTINLNTNYKIPLLSIALSHQYIWSAPKNKYKTASEENRISQFNKKENFIKNKLFGYDIIIFGDNHIGFKAHLKDTTIINCGSLMRRHKDQIDYKPKAWLIYSNGEVEPHYLDISKDKYLEPEELEKKEKKQQEFNMEDMAKRLKELGASAFEFKNFIEDFFQKNKTNPIVKEIIKEEMK